MMAAYQPQPGAMHPGMAAHGHPAITPGGQPMNPAQLQQMGHPGVSGPGQPHVTQAGAMMGMQPSANGMGVPAGMPGQHSGAQIGGMPGQMGAQSMAGGVPNAHALSHLNPQQQMAQQQQLLAQQMQANPQFALQQQQQHQQQQQALMRQRMAQMQANGMSGMQQGAMQGMNAQQLQQLQQNNPGMHPQSLQLPQHLHVQQQQLQQQMMAQQRQQAQSQQMQQQLAMHHANSQQSNQGGQPGAQNQQASQAQHPGQMRPQSRMANSNEQNQGGPQQNAQQGSQGQQQQQVQQNQQQGQQQNAQQQGGQQQMNPQQLQMLRQRQMQQQLQQNAAAQQRMAQAQANQAGQSGQYILRFLAFCDEISRVTDRIGKEYDHWRTFVDRQFSPDAQLLHSFQFESGTKQYTVPRPTIARYFQMYFDSGAQSIKLHAEQASESLTNNNRMQVTFETATLTVSYANGARLEMSGRLSVLFVALPTADLIEKMDLHTSSSEEIIMRAEIERLLSNWSPTMSSKTSPKMAKKNIPKGQQKLQSQLEGLTIDHFPKAQKGTWGVTARVQQFLEIGDTLNLMSDLMSFAQEKRMRPEAAVQALVEQYQKEGGPNGDAQANQQGNPQINLPVNGVPAGNRTPSMQNMQMPNAQGNQFSSPAMANLNLPMQNGIAGMNGSPHIANNTGLAPNINMQHTPSPHQSNMAAPQMVPQHSQQGTNSSGPSANTSPSMNNKRRRSTVKMEGDEGGGEGTQGANRVKPSPRMGKKAKP